MPSACSGWKITVNFNARWDNPVRYRNVVFDEGFRADLVVEAKVIVELKSVERVAPVHPEQLLTHLRLADLRLGLLINFNVELLRDGIKRVVNDLDE